MFITYVFITAVPWIKLFACWEGESGGHVGVCVFITAVPIIKLFARGEGDSGGHVLRETTSRLLRPVWTSLPITLGFRCVCVYYCRTYYKAVCGGGGGQ